jgi:hypothetical protein
MWCCLYSCKEYVDDLQGLGKRVEALEDSTLNYSDLNKNIEMMMKLAQYNGFVTSIVEGDDGTYTINLKGDFDADGVFSDSTIVLKNGARGENGAGLGDLLTIKKDGDNYYWFFDGDYLYDEFDNRVPVRGENGKNGPDGKDADPVTSTITLPQLRVNVYGYWEISNDGGKTWKTTTTSVNGPNGKPDPVVVKVVEDTDVLIVVVVIDSKVVTLTLPKKK